MKRLSIKIITLILLLKVTTLNAGEIHKAVSAGDLEKVKTLIEADPVLLNSKDEGGNTPLHSACRSGQVQVAMFLLDEGAEVNSKNNYGFTPLLNACGGMNPNVSIIKKLISNGADVNAKLDRGLTALHFATMSGNLKIIKLLIDIGVDLNIYDYGCYGTALHIAINLGKNEDVIKTLIESGAKFRNFSFGNSELHLAAIKGYADLIGLLVNHGAKINALNDYNRSPIYYAAKLGYPATVDALINMGADKELIVETNYGKAPQITSKLNKHEAYLWYIGGLYGQGYTIRTKNHLLVFDKTEIDESPEAGLSNGRLNPNELSGQNITLFITKAMGLTNASRPFQIAEKLPEASLVIDSDSKDDGLRNIEFSKYHIAVPDESFSINGIEVYAIKALGQGYGGAKGLGYIVEADGLKIFHSGFHVSGYDASEKERYRKEIDKLKSFGPIDIAILTVSGHLTVAYEPYLYLIDQLSPKAVYLMGGDQVTEGYPKCVKVLQARNIPVKYPEGGIAKGERFHFKRDLLTD